MASDWPDSVQPTELVKISLILFLAVVISRMGLKINEFRNVRAIIIWCGVPALLITENNLSSGIITCGIVFVVLFVACKIKWPFFACAGAGIGLIAVSPYIGKALVAVRLLKPYQLDRITRGWIRRLRTQDIRRSRVCTPSAPAAFSEEDWDRAFRSLALCRSPRTI